MVGVMTGSKQVITLNLNRIIQDWNALFRRNFDIIDYDNLKSYFISILDRIYKYHTAYNQMLHWTKDHN
jgi:ribonucleoside-triphosphate reductase